jgi:hypothetical protein
MPPAEQNETSVERHVAVCILRSAFSGSPLRGIEADASGEWRGDGKLAVRDRERQAGNSRGAGASATVAPSLGSYLEKWQGQYSILRLEASR